MNIFKVSNTLVKSAIKTDIKESKLGLGKKKKNEKKKNKKRKSNR